VLGRVWRKGTPIYCWECKLVQSFWKRIWRFLKRTETRSTIWSTYPTLGYISKRNEIIIPKRYLQVNVLAVFTIAKIGNQPRYTSMDKFIKKMWYIYTIGNYSTTKKNEIQSFATKCIEEEVRHRETILSHIWKLKINNNKKARCIGSCL
jgi:hypothetical protein